MTDNTWAAKVLEGVPRFQTMSGNMLPYADVLDAIAKLAEGDGLVERRMGAYYYGFTKLAKAVDGLEAALRYNTAMHGGAGAYNRRIKDIIAEIKGGDHE